MEEPKKDLTERRRQAEKNESPAITTKSAGCPRDDDPTSGIIIKMSRRKDLKEKAAKWFSEKWGIPEQTYLESMEDSFTAVVPAWYLYIVGDRILAGMGVIENDFHERKDLTPNVCAVYTEPCCRGQGIAGKLLRYVCEDMRKNGICTLYLLTDHTGFYERYGWTFYAMVRGDGAEEPSRMYVHSCE